MNNTTYNKILSKGIEGDLPVNVGENKLRFTTDTGRLFLDNEGLNRVEITDFVKGLTKDQILNTVAPLPKVYLSSDTYEIFVYDNTIHDWVNYGGKFRVLDLTQEEYDELSPEEKADPNKLYLIDDDTIYLTTEDIQYGTSANWRSKPTLVSRSNTIYVYTDHRVDEGVNIPSLKIGDGVTYVDDLPFLEVGYAEYANFAENASSAYYATSSQNADYASTASWSSWSAWTDNATSAEYAQNAENASSADYASDSYQAQNADYATSASWASSAEYSTNADTADYAENAAYATTAAWADIADTANKAENADTATYSVNAGTSEYAENASSADYASSADTAENASSADYASSAYMSTSANYAEYAEDSNHANYAVEAGDAARAESAENASSASWADSAGTAENASSASWADSAGTAENASSASWADNANYANSAEYASTTTFAESAENAGWASTADNANYADNAGTADYATSVGAVTWDNVTDKPSTFAPIIGNAATQAAAGNHNHDGVYLATGLKGAANGVAELGSDGKVPSSQLPSYVDDVIEYDSKSNFPATGESGKIYIAKDTNKTYRWGGTDYVEISESLALGETDSTAYRGDRGKIAYDHSQTAHAPSNAEKNQNAFSNVTVGSTTIAADTTTDTLTLAAGDNITLTPDATNDKVTIAANNTTYDLSPYQKKTEKINNAATADYASTAGTANAVAWSNVSGKPSEYPPSDHSHPINIDSGLYEPSTVFSFGTKYRLTAGGSTYAFQMPNATTYPIDIVSGTFEPTTVFSFGSKYRLTAGGSTYAFQMPNTPVYDISMVSGLYTSNIDLAANTVYHIDAGGGNGYNFKTPPNPTSVANASTADYAKSVTWDNVSGKPNTFAPIIGNAATQAAAGNHNHDGTYYKKTDTVANATNAVTATYATTAGTANAVAWGNVSDKPTTFAPVIGNAATQAAAGNHTHSAYVNQNAFSNVVVGSTTVAADTTTDTLTLAAGSNITITPDATNDKVTIAANDTTYDLSPYQKKADKIDNAATADYATTAASANSVAWGNVSGKPNTYAPIIGSASTQAAAGDHNHDGTYYKKTDTVTNATNASTANYAKAAPWSGITGTPSTYPPSTHSHDVFSTSANGFVPKPASTETGKFLKGDGTWANPSDADHQYFAGTGLNAASVSGNNTTFALATTGTAGTYGPSANVTGSNGTTIKVPQITTDAYGRVTAVTERTYTSVNTDNDTKVTAVGNHYTPSTNNASSISKSATGGSAGIWGTTNMVSGVTLKRDAAGHVTDMELSSVALPANPNTDTKVTAVGNHYTPATDNASSLSANAASGTATWNTDVVKGVTIKRDAKGHVTGLEVSSIKIPANPNTDHQYFAGTGLNAASTSGNNTTFALSTSGATSGSYGMANATTGTNNTNINIPYITVDSYGRVTSISNKTYTSVDHTYTLAGLGGIPTTQKGAANGVAELDENGLVPSSQLPSYVDDVIEGYYFDNKFWEESTHSTQITPESGKIYVDLTSGNNKSYRWSGTAYIVIASDLALGESSSDAYRGDRGKIAYDHSQAPHAPSNAQPNQNAFSNVAVGSTTIAADTTTDTLTLAGSNITITPDATNDKVTFNLSTVTSAATKGATGNVTGTEGTTIKIPKITIDTYGRVTALDEYTLTNKNTTYSFSNNAPTLSWGAASTIGTAGGTTYTVKMLDKPTPADIGAAATGHKHAWSDINSGKPTTISGYGITDFKSITTSAIAPNSSTVNQIGYTNGTSAIYGQSDGALFAQAYSSAWVAQIYQDYRSGHIAVRGNNNSTWTEWGRVFDTRNVTGASGITINSTTAGITINGTTYNLAPYTNQNAFSNVAVGSTTIAADTTTDTLTLVAGSNVTLTPDATNDKITIAATDTNTTYSLSRDGEKVKLTGSNGGTSAVQLSDLINGLGEGTSSATAEDYIVAQYAGGGSSTTTYYRRKVGKVLDALTKTQVTTALGYTPPTTNTTYTNGTGIALSGTTFSLATSGATSGSYGMANATTGTNNTNINIPYITVDSYGRVTSISNKTYTSVDHTYTIPVMYNTTLAYNSAVKFATLGSTTYTMTLPNVSSAALPDSGATAGSYGMANATTGTEGTNINIPYITVDAKGRVTSISNKTYTSKNTTYSGTSGRITLSGTAFDLATTGTAGTYGPTANVTGNNGTTIKVPQITTDAYGRVTAVTERTYTSVNTDNDTKNTAGSTDTSSKIFLVGATSQAANPQTYSDNEVYTTSGVLTAKSMQVGGGAATIQYNSNTQSIDFVFAS